MTDVKFRSDVTVKLINTTGSDAGVIAAARVSTVGADSEEWLSVPPSESEGLIRFLMRNRHGTPFEHNLFTFLVEAPIFVFREFHRHRIGWSYNEESGRYKQLEPVFYIPGPYRNLIQTGKPGAYEFHPGTPDQYARLELSMTEDCIRAYEEYEFRLEMGVAREVARMTLPLNIYSSMYATCNARSLMAFLSLRTNRPESKFPSKPMREIEMVAERMEDEFAHTMPITHAAFEAHGRVCP